MHTGRAQQSAQGWAGPWPAGRSGGRRRRGRPPPPFSLPATAAANHQVGARPWRGLPRPRNSQTPSFRGKKNQSSWQRGGQWWPSRHSGSHAGTRGVRGYARVSIAIPSRARRAGRRVDRGGREVSLRTDRAAIAGRGKGPAHPEQRLCKTFGSGPGTRGQYPRTRAPQRGCSPRRLGLCPRPAGPRESSPAARAPAGARRTYPEPRGGRAGRVGGRAWRAAGEDVRLRACARGAPRFNCRARARFRAPLVPRARLGQWGAGWAGQSGAAEPMSGSAQVKGGGTWRAGPLGRSRRWGWAWASWRGPSGRAGE